MTLQIEAYRLRIRCYFVRGVTANLLPVCDSNFPCARLTFFVFLTAGSCTLSIPLSYSRNLRDKDTRRAANHLGTGSTFVGLTSTKAF